jgi:WhiB family transcriptional regulator, redox-sensing transcriptional regulator
MPLFPSASTDRHSRSPHRAPSLDQATQAKAICGGCPARRHCLAFALNTRQDHGIWGGTSEHERSPRAAKTPTRT